MGIKGVLVKKIIVKRVLQVLVMGVIFFFLTRNLYQNWQEISTYEWRLNFHWLISSFLLMVVCALLIALGWNLILRALGGLLKIGKALKIFFLAELARYLPGKVWSMVGRVYLCRQQGVPVSTTSASLVLQTLVQVVSGLLIFLVSLPFWNSTQGIGNLYVFFWLIPPGLLLLHPGVITRTVNFSLKRLKRDPVEWNAKYRHILGILLLWCGFRMLYGTANYFLILSIYPVPVSQLPVLIGIFSIAWVVGFLSFLTPSGLGVVEGMLTFLLSFYVPLHIATLIALLSRAWTIGTDLTCVAITSRF